MKPEETERLYIESLFKSSNISSEKPVVEKLTGDASTRKYFRLHLSDGTYVVCLDDPIDNQEKYTFEQVQEVFLNNNIRVPLIHFINREKGFIVEEDLGNTTLLECLGRAKNKKEIKAIYLPVMDELIKIHKINSANYPNIPLTEMKFDHAKLHDETRVTNLNFIIKLLGVSDKDPSINILDQSFSKVCKYLGNGPWVITHRDLHSRNIMYKNEEMVVIDFQDARLGLAQYDLVSLLEDCYFNIEQDTKEELVEYYLKNCGMEFADFEQHYDMMAIQRLYKAIGSFSYIYITRGDARYLKFIGRSFERIISLLSKYEEYQNLRLNLAKIYYAS